MEAAGDGQCRQPAEMAEATSQRAVQTLGKTGLPPFPKQLKWLAGAPWAAKGASKLSDSVCDCLAASSLQAAAQFQAVTTDIRGWLAHAVLPEWQGPPGWRWAPAG